MEHAIVKEPTLERCGCFRHRALRTPAKIDFHIRRLDWGGICLLKAANHSELQIILRQICLWDASSDRAKAACSRNAFRITSLYTSLSCHRRVVKADK